MPRALLLCEYPALNGGERSLLAVLPAIQQAGWEFEAWCPGLGPLAAEFQSMGVRRIPIGPKFDSRTAFEERRAELAALLRAEPHYDLVHANSLSMGRLCGPVAAEVGIPSIAHLRDIVSLNRTVVRDLNCNSRLIAVSGAVRTYHIEQGLAAEKSVVVYNGIDLELFKPSEPTGYLNSELGIKFGCPLVGIVGQITLRKSPDTALTAIIPLVSRFSMSFDEQPHVVIVGKRHSEKSETVEYERKLHALIDRFEARPHVHFLGTRNDMPQLMPELSLLIHTAKQEPFGRVLLEAAACGVPIIATNVGGTAEMFPRELLDGAYLVSVGDSFSVKESARRILREPELAAAMSIAGRNRITTAFSVEQSAAGLLRHYAEVSGR